MKKLEIMKRRRIKKLGLEIDQNVWVIFAIVLVIAVIIGILVFIDAIAG